MSGDDAESLQKQQKQLALAHAILCSDQFYWLAVGSDYVAAQRQALGPAIRQYWAEYGSVGIYDQGGKGPSGGAL